MKRRFEAMRPARISVPRQTDGKPNDLDHYEGRHGIGDSRMAVREARRRGQAVHGVVVGAKGEARFPRICGRGGFSVIGDAARLTVALPENCRHLVGSRPRPRPRAITEAEEALLRLRWLAPADARLLWLRANRTPWKPICGELGISRGNAHTRWRYGVAVVVRRLNGREPHLRRGIGFVIEKAC